MHLRETRLYVIGLSAFVVAGLSALQTATAVSIPLSFTTGGQTFTAKLNLSADVNLIVRNSADTGNGKADVKFKPIIGSSTTKTFTLSSINQTKNIALDPNPTTINTIPTGSADLSLTGSSLQNAGLANTSVQLIDGTGVGLSTTTATYSGTATGKFSGVNVTLDVDFKVNGDGSLSNTSYVQTAGLLNLGPGAPTGSDAPPDGGLCRGRNSRDVLNRPGRGPQRQPEDRDLRSQSDHDSAFGSGEHQRNHFASGRHLFHDRFGQPR